MKIRTIMGCGIVAMTIYALLSLAALLIPPYAIGSILVSFAKTSLHECGTKYGVEPFLYGDLFCPKK